ncbi:MAG: aspartate-semialdehyde dehydrogenase [Hadesarchaea archaeon]|nr:MAG: aspartate-semialdehyde dehydrogenase [Hadesarchaea archaeon]
MRSVGILGATGEVGQKFILSLQDHPWFRVEELYASSRSAGKTYGEALRYGREDSRWFYSQEPKKEILEMEVKDLEEIGGRVSFFFSALPSEVALEVEGRVAREKPVVSTASAFRYFEDSFTYLPSVNESQAPMIEEQRRRRGWRGFVVPQPNCTTIGLALSLKPLYDAFGLEEVIMASMQAVSGAGYEAVSRWAEQRRRQGTSLPGPLEEYSPLTFEGNVIPYIKGEEEKVRKETVRLLGRLEGGRVVPAGFRIACKCNRVPVLEGHTESVFVVLSREASVEELKESWRSYRGEPQRLRLPSAPPQPVVVREEVDRPQPRFDSLLERGMVAVVGGVEANQLERGFQYTVLSHNTELGAARGAVLAAEYLHKKGYL